MKEQETRQAHQDELAELVTKNQDQLTRVEQEKRREMEELNDEKEDLRRRVCELDEDSDIHTLIGDENKQLKETLLRLTNEINASQNKLNALEMRSKMEIVAKNSMISNIESETRANDET